MTEKILCDILINKVGEEKMTKEDFMKEALKEAKKASRKDEVPVGAIIVKNRRDYSVRDTI